MRSRRRRLSRLRRSRFVRIRGRIVAIPRRLRKTLDRMHLRCGQKCYYYCHTHDRYMRSKEYYNSHNWSCNAGPINPDNPEDTNNFRVPLSVFMVPKPATR